MKLWEVGEFLKKKGIEHKFFYFEGSRSFRETDFPQEVGEYDSPDGVLSNFTLGKEVVGDWVRVFKRHYPGDPWVASIYCCVYVRKKDVGKAEELFNKLLTDIAKQPDGAM